MVNEIYDTIIIGSGLAGLTASIYSSRYKVHNLVIGKLPGGTITLAHNVENFPGFPSISGLELAQKVVMQTKKLGAEILPDFVAKVEKVNGSADQKISSLQFSARESSNPTSESSALASADSEILTSPAFFRVTTESNQVYEAKTLIATTGTERRKLGVPGEKEYLGKGVSYCTHCDAPFFKGKVVAMIGGSSATVRGALHIAGFAEKVFIIYRGKELRAEPVWVEQALKNPKVEVIYTTNVVEILGDGNRVAGVKLDNPYQGKNELPLDGVFVEIGGIPASNFLVPLGVALDENGYVKVNERMETSVPGVFAAGDFTTQSLILQQAITACAQGAVAASSAFRYLKTQKASFASSV